MDSEFSYFKAPVTNLQPYKPVTLEKVFQVIGGNWFAERTARLRELQGEEARRFKSVHFDYCTFSGTFSIRNSSALVKHSGLLCLDFDHIGPDIPYLKNAFIRDTEISCLMAFTSPSGDGLKVIVGIDLLQATHKEWFSGMSNYFFTRYAIAPDKSGSDVSRACFLPHDTECYYTPKAPHPFIKDWLPTKRGNEMVNGKQNWGTSMETKDGSYYVDQYIREIETYQLDLTVNYNDWVTIGFAFAAEFGETGRGYFHRVSKFYPKYTPSETNRKYDLFLNDHRSGITIRSFFYICRQAGIKIQKQNTI